MELNSELDRANKKLETLKKQNKKLRKALTLANYILNGGSISKGIWPCSFLDMDEKTVVYYKEWKKLEKLIIELDIPIVNDVDDI